MPANPSPPNVPFNWRTYSYKIATIAEIPVLLRCNNGSIWKALRILIDKGKIEEDIDPVDLLTNWVRWAEDFKEGRIPPQVKDLFPDGPPVVK
jgi:hypothetical protein